MGCFKYLHYILFLPLHLLRCSSGSNLGRCTTETKPCEGILDRPQKQQGCLLVQMPYDFGWHVSIPTCFATGPWRLLQVTGRCRLLQSGVTWRSSGSSAYLDCFMFKKPDHLQCRTS
eukprot:1816926-Amphidinium_carterae.3